MKEVLIDSSALSVMLAIDDSNSLAEIVLFGMKLGMYSLPFTGDGDLKKRPFKTTLKAH